MWELVQEPNSPLDLKSKRYIFRQIQSLKLLAIHSKKLSASKIASYPEAKDFEQSVCVCASETLIDKAMQKEKVPFN